MTTTIGMWEMVSELLEGEKLPVSMNEALEGLCNGDLVIAERHEFRKLEADNHALKAEISSLKRKVNHEHIRAELALANRNLTNDEITEIYFDDPDILVFARAILRKAQEHE